MRVNFKYGIIISAFLLFFSLEVFTQNNPPAPQMNQETNGDGPPCAPKGDGNGGFPNPPPPGLCLPIDDYIPYLVIGGMLIGLIYTGKKATKPGEVH